MKNSNVSDLVALAMSEQLESDDMKSLFNLNYVKAEPCADLNCADDHVDDNDAKSSDPEDEAEDNCSADDADDDNDADTDEDGDEDDSAADDASLALEAADANLLTASAALDAAGFEKTASLSFRIASFVAEAKAKKDTASSKKKLDKKKKKNPFAKKKPAGSGASSPKAKADSKKPSSSAKSDSKKKPAGSKPSSSKK